MLILKNLTQIKEIHWECCFFFILLHIVDIYSFAHRESEKTCCKLFSHLYSTETNNMNLSTTIPRNPKVKQHNYQSVKYLNKNSQKCLTEQTFMSIQWHSNTTRDKGAKSFTFSTGDGCGTYIHPHKMCWQGKMIEVWKTSQTNTAWQTIKPTSQSHNFQVSFPIKSK